jgi:hypothetical protein
MQTASQTDFERPMKRLHGGVGDDGRENQQLQRAPGFQRAERSKTMVSRG